MSNQDSIQIPVDLISIPAGALRQSAEDGTSKEKEYFESFCRDIAKRGILNPIAVVEVENGKYEVIDGVQRLSACKKLGHGFCPAYIVKDKSIIDSMAANLYRKATTTREYAVAVKMAVQSGKSLGDIANLLGVLPVTIEKWVNINNLPDTLRKRIFDGDIGITAADVVLKRRGLSGQEKQEILSKFTKDTTSETAKTIADNAAEAKRKQNILTPPSAPSAPKAVFSQSRFKEIEELVSLRFIAGDPEMVLLSEVIAYVNGLSNDNPLINE